MRILIVTPAPPRSRKGNRVTAVRWARIMRGLGHTVAIAQEYRRQRCDLLIALHALRSYPSISRFRRLHPESLSNLIVTLTGTDLYGDIRTDERARHALDLADALIVLQSRGIGDLPEGVRAKARVIYQSIQRPPGLHRPRRDTCDICVIGHLRPVKDPFRAAEASRLLPASSTIRVLHIGGALSDDMERQAHREAAANPRYRWLGELPRWRTIRALARSRLLVLSSEMEGGAHVICEALACGVPVLSSDIPGSVGLLGEAYPGYFPVGDTRALSKLLLRCETDSAFYTALKHRCESQAALVDPARETESWAELLAELGRAKRRSQPL